MIRPSRTLMNYLDTRFFSTSARCAKNLDIENMNHLSSFSSKWWDQTGVVKPLHHMNQIRIPLIRDGLISSGIISSDRINKVDVLSGVKILDVGCGAGILAEPLARLKAEVTGLDASEELIEVAKHHLKGQLLNVDYRIGTIEDHSTENPEQYDAIVASEVIEHIPDKKEFLHACVKSLKVGGSLFITTFNKTQASWLAGIIAAEYIFNVIPKGTHDWDSFISPEEVTKILNDVDCTTVLVHGTMYEFWRNKASFTSYDGIHYALQAVKHASK